MSFVRDTFQRSRNGTYSGNFPEQSGNSAEVSPQEHIYVSKSTSEAFPGQAPYPTNEEAFDTPYEQRAGLPGLFQSIKDFFNRNKQTFSDYDDYPGEDILDKPQKIDWKTWILGFVASLLLIGLIPFWLYIYWILQP
jgi:hypothetical protein